MSDSAIELFPDAVPPPIPTTNDPDLRVRLSNGFPFNRPKRQPHGQWIVCCRAMSRELRPLTDNFLCDPFVRSVRPLFETGHQRDTFRRSTAAAQNHQPRAP